MKEATGELNMTVVTVVAIAAVAAFFYAFVWPGIKSSIQASTYCAMAQCGSCSDGGNGVTKCDACEAYGEDGETVWTGKCTFKNGEQPAGGVTGGNGGQTS